MKNQFGGNRLPTYACPLSKSVLASHCSASNECSKAACSNCQRSKKLHLYKIHFNDEMIILKHYGLVLKSAELIKIPP